MKLQRVSELLAAGTLENWVQRRKYNTGWSMSAGYIGAQREGGALKDRAKRVMRSFMGHSQQ